MRDNSVTSFGLHRIVAHQCAPTEKHKNPSRTLASHSHCRSALVRDSNATSFGLHRIVAHQCAPTEKHENPSRTLASHSHCRSALVRDSSVTSFGLHRIVAHLRSYRKAQEPFANSSEPQPL